MVDSGIIFFVELAVLGALYVFLSHLEYKVATIDEVKPFLKAKAYATAIIVLGILVHTLGDAWKYEMQLETLGHFIIMIAAVIMIRQTLGLWKIAEEFGYG